MKKIRDFTCFLLLVFLFVIFPAREAVGASNVKSADTQPPSAPIGLTLSSHSHTSLNLSWSPSADDTGVKGYTVYRNGSRVGTTSTTGYTVKRLLPGTTYSFFVKAYDSSDNYSAPSSSVPGTTLPDTKAPGKAFGLKGTSVTETQITLMWSPATDDVKVKNYEVYCNGVKKGTPARTILTAKNLIPGKAYKFNIIAVDTVGNRSDSSESVVITTLKDLKKPSTPAGLKAVKVKGSSVSLEWDASSDNTKVSGYIIYCNGAELERSKKASRTVTNKSKPVIGIYWVRAYDLSGNLSDASNKVTIIRP